METIKIQYGSDTVMMTWDGAQASAPILLDGEQTGYQTADARHRTAQAVRLCAAKAWPEIGPLVSDWADGTEAWDALSYEAVETVEADDEE